MGTYSTTKTEVYTGKQLKDSSVRPLNYKDNYCDKKCLLDDKKYIVKISEFDDSEGWDYTRYTIEDTHPELEQMIEKRKFEEAVKEEINRKNNEYFNKKREKYMKMTHDELVEKLIKFEKDILWVIE